MAFTASRRLLSLLVETPKLDTSLDKVVCLAAEVVAPGDSPAIETSVELPTGPAAVSHAASPTMTAAAA